MKATSKKSAASVPATVVTGNLEWSHPLSKTCVNYANAERLCVELGEGWRLPTLDELQSICDRTRYCPTIDTTRFPDTKSDWYWTSTPYAASPDYAWYVGFYHGNVDLVRRGYDHCFVRAVRSVPASQ